ncbi:malvidin galactosylase UGT88C3-like [Aristolochia californica]|uniref:malvidin galactosylase UGT88C3-like n=1 Tax=Aristolochia californica TaxID=171875 RepID=UPI0035E3360E
MKVGLVILPMPDRGHLASTVEFAKRINQHNQFSITILNMAPPFPSFSSLPASYYESISSSGLDIHFHDLPQVEPPGDPSSEAFISLYIASHATHVRNSILRLQSSVRVAALVVDLFATTMTEVGNELGIPTYLFFTCGAALLALMLHIPNLDLEIKSEFEDLKEDVEVPGLGRVPPLVMPSPLMNKKDEGYWWFVEHSRRFRYMKGLIVNTYLELESAALEAVGEGRCLPDYPTPPVFSVGPVLVLEEKDHSHPCIEWLDTQPPQSVVFLCFGSMGDLPEPQVKEIALGIERSGHRFLCCIRVRRSDEPAPSSASDLDDVLPDGFVERTKGNGLVWPRWAPQTAILSHGAVGGFVSHCGWNSCLESLWFGVPMLAWPLDAEQRLNGFELVNKVGTALELQLDYKDGGIVDATEVERGVRLMMEDPDKGKRAREKAMEMRAASRAAVEEGGSSFDELRRLTEQLLSPMEDYEVLYPD